MLLRKLQENEQLKYELSELQSQLDAAVTPTDELRSQRLSASETPPQPAVISQPYSFTTDTSTASDSIDGTDCDTSETCNK